MTDTTQNSTVELTDAPRGAAVRLWEWARANLFNSPLNTVLTLAITYVFLRFLWPLLRWATIDSTWNAPNDRACQATGGACWAFLKEWGRFLLFGRYPYEEQWRPALVLALFVTMLLVSARRSTGGRTLLAMWGGGLVVIFALMWGGFPGMPYVETDLWNGLPLNLILALGGVGFSFPVAILVALGRRSRLPAIRWLSVAYIELIRGVPLITVLFMSALMVPLFLPGGASIAKLWRAEVAFTLFFGAYLAEAIRAGLQVIPRGQYEAAELSGPRLLAQDALDHPAAGAGDLDPGHRQRGDRRLQGHGADHHRRHLRRARRRQQRHQRPQLAQRLLGSLYLRRRHLFRLLPLYVAI